MRLRRKFVFKTSLWIIFFLVLYLNRFNILRGMGNYLIRTDKPEYVDAMFVLSGNSLDRGKEAARLFKQGYTKKIICTGGESSGPLKAYGLSVTTCDLTVKVLEDNGVDSSVIERMPVGTSTFEEFEAIRTYCKENKIKKTMVVSSSFHTRRINQLFRGPLQEDGIGLVLIGADESAFDEQEWWKQEEGLIFLNNEYVKIVYYMMKY